MQQKLVFSTTRIEALLIKDENFAIGPPTIVYNLSNNPLAISAEHAAPILPWQSAVLSNVTIHSETAVLIEVKEKFNLAAECLSLWTNYHQLAPDYPEEKMLFISDQETVGTTTFNPKNFRQENFDQGKTNSFDIKLNLWYTPSQNDCMIHNRHSFLEVHTQVYGESYMQAFHTDAEGSLYRHQPMLPGFTHEPWFIIAEDGSWAYPWHRYLSGTDCVWLAVEFHPVSNEISNRS
jgi:hypothetical protein